MVIAKSPSPRIGFGNKAVASISLGSRNPRFATRCAKRTAYSDKQQVGCLQLNAGARVATTPQAQPVAYTVQFGRASMAAATNSVKLNLSERWMVETPQTSAANCHFGLGKSQNTSTLFGLVDSVLGICRQLSTCKHLFLA